MAYKQKRSTVAFSTFSFALRRRPSKVPRLRVDPPKQSSAPTSSAPASLKMSLSRTSRAIQSRGLTRDDFSLKEDGREQRLLSFDFHDGAKPDFTPPKLAPLPANTFAAPPSVPEQGWFDIILYDMVNMELEDQAFSCKPLLDVIDSKPPGPRRHLPQHRNIR